MERTRNEKELGGGGVNVRMLNPLDWIIFIDRSKVGKTIDKITTYVIFFLYREIKSIVCIEEVLFK